jgi:hypothetical protein
MPKKPAHVENYCAMRAMVEELLSDLKAGDGNGRSGGQTGWRRAWMNASLTMATRGSQSMPASVGRYHGWSGGCRS